MSELKKEIDVVQPIRLTVHCSSHHVSDMCHEGSACALGAQAGAVMSAALNTRLENVQPSYNATRT
jgi:hypothetical protein